MQKFIQISRETLIIGKLEIRTDLEWRNAKTVPIHAVSGGQRGLGRRGAVGRREKEEVL